MTQRSTLLDSRLQACETEQEATTKRTLLNEYEKAQDLLIRVRRQEEGFRTKLHRFAIRTKASSTAFSSQAKATRA